MGENLSRKFATMSEEERRRYAMEPERAEAAREGDESSQELEFGEPRREHGTTRGDAGDKDEVYSPGEDETNAGRARERGSDR